MNLQFSYFKIFVVLIFTSVIFYQPVLAQPTELTLDDSIMLALKNNPSLQIVEAQKEQATWAIKEVKSNKDISINYIHTDRRSTAPQTWISSLEAVSPYNYFSNQIIASIPIYTGGKIENSIKQAELNDKISELEIITVKQQLKFETSAEYYNILQNQTLLEIAEQTVIDFKAHLERVQQMYDTGVVPWHDILQTKVKLANAENNLVKAQNDYDLAVHRLNKTIGLPLGSEIKLTESLKYQAYTISQEAAIIYGLSHRPEMMQSQENIQIKQAQIGIAQSDHHPQIRLNGATVWNDNAFAGIKNRDWTAMLVTQFNLFDSGNIEAKIKQAESDKVAAQEQARQTQDDISLEISDAYFSIKEAEKRIETNKIAIDEACANFDIAHKSYSAGVGTNLDVMDAELALNQAKTNYTNSLFEYNISKAQLDKAIGDN